TGLAERYFGRKSRDRARQRYPRRRGRGLAQQPPRIEWAPSAFRQFQGLPLQVRKALRDRIPLLEQNPEMHQVESRGHWADLRRIPIRGWVVFYAFWHADRAIYIEALAPARSGRR